MVKANAKSRKALADYEQRGAEMRQKKKNNKKRTLEDDDDDVDVDVDDKPHVNGGAKQKVQILLLLLLLLQGLVERSGAEAGSAAHLLLASQQPWSPATHDVKPPRVELYSRPPPDVKPSGGQPQR